MNKAARDCLPGMVIAPINLSNRAARLFFRNSPLDRHSKARLDWLAVGTQRRAINSIAHQPLASACIEFRITCSCRHLTLMRPAINADSQANCHIAFVVLAQSFARVIELNIWRRRRRHKLGQGWLTRWSPSTEFRHFDDVSSMRRCHRQSYRHRWQIHWNWHASPPYLIPAAFSNASVLASNEPPLSIDLAISLPSSTPN